MATNDIQNLRPIIPAADILESSDSVLSSDASNTHNGINSVYVVAALLRQYGYKAEICSSYTSPYDLLVNGKRVEVKACARRESGDWSFNIHRHGVLDESQTDVYIFRLENVPEFSYAVHLLIEAPLETPTINISLRSLVIRYGRHYNQFGLLGKPTRKRKYTLKKQKASQGVTL